MKSIFKVVLVSILLIGIKDGYSQQDPQYTQYMYNTMSVNPAYAGSKGHGFLTALARTQWVGVDGAPQTQTLGYDTPLGSGLGLGVNLVNDAIGPSNETYLEANVAYGIKTGEESKLALGLKLGGRLFSINPNKGVAKNKGSLDLEEINNKFFGTVGAGLYFYTSKGYIGFAVPNFIPVDYYDDTLNGGTVARERFHFFTIAGYVFELSETLKFKPAALFKGVSGAPVSLDISANFLFNEKFRAGLAWRWGDSISALVGFNISERFQIGYAYDLTTSNYSNYNSGSHEVMLTYDFLRQGAVVSPRFF